MKAAPPAPELSLGPAKGPPLNRFGITDRLEPFTQMSYNRRAFSDRLTGIIPRTEVFQNIADGLAPHWFEWHPWTMRILNGLTRRRWVALAGCSGSSKTRNVAGFACTWWLAAPEESSVIFCSTTMKSLRKRGWAEVQSYNRAIGGDFGNFVDSRTVWQHRAGDDLHAIFGIAVQEGEIDKVAANIQGIHTRRQLVVIDEAEAVPGAIWKACANLWSYPVDAGGEFILCAIANPRSRLSQFGRFIEPETGWDSVSVETEEWEGRPQLDGKKTFVIRLDFLKSPNVTEGRTVSKHLPRKDRVEAQMKALKERNAENDPDFWCYCRGFPAPEGLSKTVFTESMFDKFKAYDRHVFTGNGWMILGAFDPAYGGGDRPALRFGAYGEIQPGLMGLEWMAPVVISLDATSKDPARYQLLYQVRKHAEKVMFRGQPYSCPPENIAIDASGDAGLADIAQREWSPNIIRIQFGGSASEEPAGLENSIPANIAYKNKRAEMFYRSRALMESGQLKGVDRDTAEELVAIEYSDMRSDGTLKPISLLDKIEFKKKFGKSCDLADCGVMLTDVARIKGMRLAAMGQTISRDKEFSELVKKAEDVYTDISYSPQDDFDEDEDFVM